MSDPLTDAVAETQRWRNYCRGWSTTNANNPMLRGMAARAGLSVSAYQWQLADTTAGFEGRLAQLTTIGEHWKRHKIRQLTATLDEKDKMVLETVCNERDNANEIS